MSTTRGVVQTGAIGEPLTVRLRGDDGDGGLAVVEMALDPGTGPPLHVHPTHAEGFYVLAREVSLQIDDEIVSGGPGTWAFAPKNVPHTLANLSGQEARLLCVADSQGHVSSPLALSLDKESFVWVTFPHVFEGARIRRRPATGCERRADPSGGRPRPWFAGERDRTRDP
ncbi:MAG: cupin domain-containing protein [Streptosporangiaceae bacterium]